MWSDEAIRFCKSVGISIPIIQAPMAGGPTTPELVATVSNSGALGSIGAGYLSPDRLRQAIREVKALTQQPFAVNLFAGSDASSKREASDSAKSKLTEIANELGLPALDFDPPLSDVLDSQLEVVCDERVPIVSTTFGLLTNLQAEVVRSSGASIIGTATCVAEAKAVEDSGCDAVVAQGFEAGGHRGTFLSTDPPMIGLMALVPQIADAVRIPVIASGAVMDGRGVAACLMLGASAVQLGTAFLTTHESGADEVWKSQLLQSDELSTILTRSFSGKSARGIRNRFIESMIPFESEVATYPLQNEITIPLRAQAKRNSNYEYMSLWSGQGSRLSRRIHADELVRTLALEVNARLKCLLFTPDH